MEKGTINGSARVGRIAGSRTAALFSKVQKMQRQGQTVLNLGIGEPGFAPPEQVIEATRAALAKGHTRYGDTLGLIELREQLALQFPGCQADQVLVTNGAKQALYSLFQSLCNPGDEVLLPLPCWVSFAEQIKLAGAVPVFVQTVAHQLDLEALADAITPKTRALVLNSPNNPTGAVFSPSDLAAVGELALRHGFFVICDDAYIDFLFDGLKPYSLYEMSALREQLIVVRSFSKGYAMTGFRVGYLVGPPPLIGQIGRLQSHLCGNVCTFAQYGALAALKMPSQWLKARQKSMEQQCNMAYDMICTHFDCIRPKGGFYLFPSLHRLNDRFDSAESFADWLLQTAGVAVVPGDAFGMAHHFRICYAVPEKTLMRALKKIEEVL